MSADNPWSLFGIDLRRLGVYVQLGVNQLLWSDSAGLRQRWYPPAALSPPSAATPLYVDEFGVEKAPVEDEPTRAVELPESLYLERSLRFPEQAELDLEAAVGMDMASNSPFPAEDLATGWRVADRTGGMITISMVLASKAAVYNWLHKAVGVAPGDETTVEVWAPLEQGGHAVLEGFAETRRRARYLTTIRGFAVRWASLLALIFALLFVPGIYTEIRSSQLAAQLQSVTQDARVATHLREQLTTRRDAIQTLETARDGRAPYHIWLNQLAAMSPDSVYLSRLQFEGAEGELSGYAVNAADFLSQLASAEKFQDISAPGAFVRDRNNGLERFTISLVLPTGKAPSAGEAP